MKKEILDFYTLSDEVRPPRRGMNWYVGEGQKYWLEQIEKSDWSAGKYLYELLWDDKLKELCGADTKVLLLTEGDSLISFCTYAEQDDVREPSLTPWVGFVYTFPEYRGHRYAGKLLEYAYSLAKADGRKHIYISTGETGLYEKYGYTFWKMKKDIHGEDSRVYRIKISDIDYTIRNLKNDETGLLEDFLYEAIFIPEGIAPPGRGILNQPELRLYVDGFGDGKADNCFVAEADSHVIGAVWTRIMDDYGHLDDETPSFAISLYKDYRGQGIGTALMLRMIDLLKKQGYQRTSLAVQKANYAVKMYQNVGFKTVDENAEEYIMVCEL